MIDIDLSPQNDLAIEILESPINIEFGLSEAINVDLSNHNINLDIASSTINIEFTPSAPTGRANNVFIQDSQPLTSLAQYLWIETDADSIKTFWVETGD